MKTLLLFFSFAMLIPLFAFHHRTPCRFRHRTPEIRRNARQIPWKSVAAGGAAAGTVIAAYKISDGVQEGLITAAREKPESFLDSLSGMTAPLRWAGVIVLFCVGYGIWRNCFSHPQKKGFFHEPTQQK